LIVVVVSTWEMNSALPQYPLGVTFLYLVRKVSFVSSKNYIGEEKIVSPLLRGALKLSVHGRRRLHQW
jgi:hypothetical protein